MLQSVKKGNKKQNMYGLTTCCTSLTPRATPCQLPPCSLYGRLEICLPFFKDLKFVCLFLASLPNFQYQNEKQFAVKKSIFGANNVG